MGQRSEVDVFNAGLLGAFTVKTLVANYKERTEYALLFYSFIHSFNKCFLLPILCQPLFLVLQIKHFKELKGYGELEDIT